MRYRSLMAAWLVVVCGLAGCEGGGGPQEGAPAETKVVPPLVEAGKISPKDMPKTSGPAVPAPTPGKP
jgi:hypothetical protein